jgi:hypothetical protein
MKHDIATAKENGQTFLDTFDFEIIFRASTKKLANFKETEFSALHRTTTNGNCGIISQDVLSAKL